MRLGVLSSDLTGTLLIVIAALVASALFLNLAFAELLRVRVAQ